MATVVKYSLVRAHSKSLTGDALPVPLSQPVAAFESKTVGATTSPSTMAADLATLGDSKPSDWLWEVFAIGDTAVCMQAGTGTPVATTTSRPLTATAEGFREWFGVTELGEKLAFINA